MRKKKFENEEEEPETERKFGFIAVPRNTGTNPEYYKKPHLIKRNGKTYLVLPDND